MYQLEGRYSGGTTGICLELGIIFFFFMCTEQMAIKLSSDHSRIKGIAKRNKREITGPGKFAKYRHGTAR